MSGELSSDKMKREAEEAELLLRQHDENLDGDMKPVDAAQSVEEDIDAIPQDTVKAFSNNVEAPTGDDDNKKTKKERLNTGSTSLRLWMASIGQKYPGWQIRLSR